jgi:glycosyltransferase involved in cell wall biosynthesis
MSYGAPRILMTTDTVGGVWVYATTLATALAEAGYEIILVTQGPPPQPHQLEAVQQVANIELAVTDFALEWMDPEGLDFARTQAGLLEIAQRTQPDIIHLNSYREAAADWPAPVIVTAHSCVRSWWHACHGEEPSERRWSTYVASTKVGLSAADHWIAPTRWFRDEIQNLYGAQGGLVIHNGITPDFRITPKEHFVLAAGRMWDQAKNLPVLANAAQHIGWPLCIAGPQQLATNTSAPAKGAEMLGDLARPELLVLMHRASVFVAPSIYEPFGLAVLEAAAAGCALVLSDIPSFRELWMGAALFVEPRNGDALAKTLRTVCEDASVRKRLQLAALRRAHRYSLANTAEAYCNLYSEMIDRRVVAPREPRYASLEALT